jgi:hypothetical protein
MGANQVPHKLLAPHRYRASLERAKAGVAARSAHEGLPHLSADTSVWSLVLVNGIALVVALVGGWQLADLMVVYWIQSVMIGTSYFFRMLGLKKFSTASFTINNRAVDPTPATKRHTAFFFLAHFGAFHVAYLVFIFEDAPGAFHPDFGLAVCTIAFAINHYFSYRYHREVDRRGTPNIGTLMFTPYFRIVPMHLTIVFGAMALGQTGLLLFGALKTTADVGMHVVEHRLLAKRHG